MIVGIAIEYEIKRCGLGCFQNEKKLI